MSAPEIRVRIAGRRLRVTHAADGSLVTWWAGGPPTRLTEAELMEYQRILQRARESSPLHGRVAR